MVRGGLTGPTGLVGPPRGVPAQPSAATRSR